MLDKLQAIYERHIYIEEQLSDPEVMSDMSRYKKVNKEYKDLSNIVEAYHEYKDLLGNMETANEMLQEDDEEMKEMAKMELDELKKRKETLEAEVRVLLIPKDPEDDKDVVFEIRSGAGGDEASLFAGDLYKMYSRYIESQRWKTEIISISEGSVGGYNKIVMEVSGNGGVYGKLKFESGAHRVQRVPKTESQGRVHTSAATVVVMPKMEMEDVNIIKSDLRVDTFRSGGAGGQHVNKTESGIRFTHLPTGIAAESTDGRSQNKNRDIAMNRLIDKIRMKQINEHDSKVTSERRSLIGSGDRSDKIRTYNWPQNRVTDHRIGLTLYNLDKIIAGDIAPVIEALIVAETARKMQEGSLQ